MPRLDARALGKRAFAWALALAALAMVIHTVPIRDHCADPNVPSTCQPGLGSTLAGVRVGWLVALFALYVTGTLAWAARWRALLALAGAKVGLLAVWRVTVESQAGGVLLPGGIGGDALRVAFMMGRGAPATTVAASVILDRLIGLATLATLATGLAAAFGGGDLGPTMVVLASFPFALVAGLALLRVPALARAPLLARGPLARIAQPVLEYVGDPRAPRALAAALAISFLVSLTQLFVIRGAIVALGATPTVERWVYLGATMSFLVGAVPGLPGGWGTSDAAFVFFLGKAGLAASIALATGLIYRLLWYCVAGIGAVLFALRRARAKVDATPPLEEQRDATDAQKAR